MFNNQNIGMALSLNEEQMEKTKKYDVENLR